jgi:hypothetical protein
LIAPVARININHIDAGDDASRHTNELAGIVRPQSCNAWRITNGILEAMWRSGLFVAAAGKAMNRSAF